MDKRVEKIFFFFFFAIFVSMLIGPKNVSADTNTTIQGPSVQNIKVENSKVNAPQLKYREGKSKKLNYQ